MKNRMAMYEISTINLLNYLCCITVFFSIKIPDPHPKGDKRSGSIK
jgi:hypothetical protein